MLLASHRNFVLPLSDASRTSERTWPLWFLTDVSRVSLVSAPRVGQFLQSVVVWSTGQLWTDDTKPKVPSNFRSGSFTVYEILVLFLMVLMCKKSLSSICSESFILIPLAVWAQLHFYFTFKNLAVTVKEDKHS